MSRRIMQRFNKMRVQITDLINSIKTNAANSVSLIEGTFTEWEENGYGEYITGKLPDEIREKMDRNDVCVNVINERPDYLRFYNGNIPYSCSLVERCFDYAIKSKNEEVVRIILSRYEKHIDNRIIFNSVYRSIENANYKFYKMLTNTFRINYRNLFIAISNSINHINFKGNMLSSKILKDIIRNIMKNSQKVSFEYVTNILYSIYSGMINSITLSYMLKNLKRYAIGPYDFNEKKYGYSFGDDLYNIFILMLRKGRMDLAMTLVDDCIMYDICKIDIIYRDMNIMYEIVNEGFTQWDEHTNVNFIEWIYHHTNGAFSIPDYLATRAPYDYMMGYYRWALHMRQLLLLIRKYYGKKVVVDMEPYARMRWKWCEIDDPEDNKYYDEHSKHIRNIFSYGCINLGDRVKSHAKFLI